MSPVITSYSIHYTKLYDGRVALGHRDRILHPANEPVAVAAAGDAGEVGADARAVAARMAADAHAGAGRRATRRRADADGGHA